MNKVSYRFLLSAAAIVAAAFITACSSDSEVRRQEYLDADYYTRLELPPDLTAPDTSRELPLPKPTERAQQEFKQEVAEQVEGNGKPKVQQSTVAINVPGAVLQSDANSTWLQVDKPAAEIWPLLNAFWQNEGIPVKRSQKELGLMETDWVAKLQTSKDAGFFESMFSSFEPDRVDRFNIRLQQNAAQTQTKIFVTHAGMEMVVEDEDTNWRSREREPALEAEILQRLALFIGEKQAVIQVPEDNYMPFASRVKKSEYDANSLEVIGNKAKVWQRTTAALQAMKVDITQQDKDAGVMQIKFQQLDPQLRGEERDEFTEASWIMNLFKDAPEDGKQFTLRLTELENYTRIDLEKQAGELDDSVLAEQFSASLKGLLQ